LLRFAGLLLRAAVLVRAPDLPRRFAFFDGAAGSKKPKAGMLDANAAGAAAILRPMLFNAPAFWIA
jgi:hypothetical protein